MDAESDKITESIQRELFKENNPMNDWETQYISSGLVDSFSFIRLLVFIEDEFRIVIPDEAAAEPMDSVSQIFGTHAKFLKAGI